jgi:hypothetical protein
MLVKFTTDHGNSALLLSGLFNLILLGVILYLLRSGFQRLLRQWRMHRRRANPENLPLLNISAVANSFEEQTYQQRDPNQQEQQQISFLGQQQQESPNVEDHHHEDLESIDLHSNSSSDHNVPVQSNWFRRLIRKRFP